MKWLPFFAGWAFFISSIVASLDGDNAVSNGALIISNIWFATGFIEARLNAKPRPNPSKVA